jgi:hypothetical protein
VETGPETVPTPAPTDPEAPPATDPDADPSGSPEEDPSATPPPAPPEPTGFALAFDDDVTFNRESCCGGGTEIQSEHVAIDDNGFGNVQQSVTGMASAAGALAYGVAIDQSFGHGQQQLSFHLVTHEGWYMYEGGGYLESQSATPWGGWTYRFVGTYYLQSKPGSTTESLPERGNYEAEVTVSSAQQRIVSANIRLTELD